MKIPKIIHQTWKSKAVPVRWQGAVESVRQHHPGWEYRLWSDPEIDALVRAHQPELWPVYRDFEKNIMRADVFRYVAIDDIGVSMRTSITNSCAPSPMAARNSCSRKNSR